VVAPQAKRACSKMCMEEHGLSERRACQLVGANRSTVRYSSKRAGDDDLTKKIRETAMQNRRYGYRRIHLILRRNGEHVNHKRVYRIYKSEGLKVRKRGIRKRAIGSRKIARLLVKANQCWALDFVHDSLLNGRKIRLLTVIDAFTRECLRIEVEHSLNGASVLRALEAIIAERGRSRCCS